jgi:uncharacterized protein (TIGR02594 family)
MKKIIAGIAIFSLIMTALVIDAGARPRKRVQQVGETTVTWDQHNNLVVKASQYIGARARDLGLPSRLWCADFMNKIFGGRDRAAISYASRGTPAPHGCTNCVAVTKRPGGHHVGIVKGYDRAGNPILISGNHGNRVAVGTYSKYRVVAYRYVKPRHRHS